MKNQELSDRSLNQELFVMTHDEAIALRAFLLNCGYISYEFHEDIHHLWSRLDSFYIKTQKLKQS